MKSHQQISSFRIITLFILLTIIGLSVIPLLDLNYRPSRKNNKITLSYSWIDVSPEIIERDVTAKLEGTLATLKGVSNIYSESSVGNGRITLSFAGVEDLQTTRFEISTLIRQVTSTFPEGVSYPIISQGGGGSSRTLLTYTLNGKYSPHELQEYGEKSIKRALVGVQGVKEVNVYGAQPAEWVMTYELDKLSSLKITPVDLENAVRNYLNEKPLGLADYSSDSNGKIAIHLKAEDNKRILWEQIPVKNIGGRIVYLTSLCTIEKTHQKPTSYYRINGLNSINIVVVAGENINELVAGKSVKQKIKTIKQTLPETMSLSVTYDSTEHLQKELFNILWRIGLSIIILILFVWLTSRSLSYIFTVIVSIFCNVAIAFIFYYLFGIEIQLYSLAGLTISLGIIIDNTIVMIDHVRHYQNKKVFLALLAATLTTIGALSIVFFLEEDQVLKLIDFAYVLAINLSVSLFISLYFIPAVLEKIPIQKKVNKRTIRNKRRVVGFGRVYLRVYGYLSRYRVVVILVFVLGFGLPIYLLPDKLGDDIDKNEGTTVQFSWYEEWYNETLGSDWYRENLHPHLEKWLGGTLYLFYQNVYSSSYYGEPERTTLYVNGKMPPGSNIQQMNEVFTELENFISQFDEVQQFETRINGVRNASITIYFKPEHEFTAFPYYLKARLTEKAIYLGGLDSSIYGVGRGFSNALNTGYKNTNLYLYGYSYKSLLDHAEKMKRELLSFERIKEVDILGTPSFFGGPNFEYHLALEPSELARQDIKMASLHNFLSQINISEQSVWRGNIEGEVANLKIMPKEADLLDVWNIKNYPVNLNDSSLTKLSGFTEITRRKAGNKIVRENQQYRIILAFDYIGSYQLKQRVIDRFVEKTNKELPIGYYIDKSRGWGRQDKASQYWLVGLVIAIVFLIGATLFESFRQPLVVVFTIPISFIGVFLTFYSFDLNFDQGGYAAFILLCGIAVNAGFFIINDFNNLKMEKPNLPFPILYLKAFQHKILPILLTICSTVAGMAPFLIDGKEQVFWFALAAGTTGGLLFSLVGVFLFLPLVVKDNVYISKAI